MTLPVRVLVVDDVEDDYLLVRRQLGRIAGAAFQLDWVATTPAAIDRMTGNQHDVYLVDYRLADGTGAELVQRAVAQGCQGPCLMLTALGDREADLAAMRAGAVDFLVKDAVTPELLERALRYALERHRNRRALAEHVEELRRANAELAQFGSILSHDLRQPLHVVAGYLELVQTMADESPRAAEFAQRAQAAVARMHALIDDVLADAKAERTAGPLIAVDTAAVFDAAVADLRLAIDAAGATVTRGALPVVRGNASQLGQLFRNLLDNALKYRSSAPPVVEVTCERSDTTCIFSVADNGIGVAPSDMHRVFSMFQRGGRGTSQGSGVGLAVCRRVVERHGGRIWVDTRESGGAVFRFSLLSAT